MGECERTGTTWEGGAKHKACDLVSDKEIMIECLGSTRGKNLHGTEFVVGNRWVEEVLNVHGEVIVEGGDDGSLR